MAPHRIAGMLVAAPWLVAAPGPVAAQAIIQEQRVRVEVAAPAPAPAPALGQVFIAGQVPEVLLDDQQFESWVFANRNASAARASLEAEVATRINDIARACDPTPEQLRALRLAARGDIERFFDQVEMLRDEVAGRPVPRDNLQQAFQRVAPLQQAYNAGLLGEDSLLTKATREVLDPDRLALYERALRERREFRHRSMVEMSVIKLGNALGLTEAQRDRLTELALERSEPPAEPPGNDRFDLYLVLHQLSEVPEEDLRPLLDDRQWAVLTDQFAEARRIVPMLEARGLLGD